MQATSEPDLRRVLLSQKSSNLFAAVILFSLFFPSILFAANDLNYHKLNQNKLFSSENKYQLYFEMGGVKHFNQHPTVAGIYDLFIPLLQKDDQLLFTDLRLFDRSGSSFEGNVHLGYRKLYSDTEQMFGIYGAFDRKRTAERNFFNQLTFGFEYWQNKFFIGGNIYKPIGVTQKPQPSTLQTQSSYELNWSKITATETQTTKQGTEKALSGADLELGYAITDNLTGYAGGYYFAAPDTKTVAGPRARFTYDYTKPTGRLLGILDGISIEAGLQYDKPRRTTAYVGIKFKIGLNPKHTSNIQGFARHMVEPVRRDPDIVYQPTEISYVTINIRPNIPITAQHIIDYFGITKDAPPQELVKIHAGLVDYLVSHLGIVDKVIETGTYYLNLLYDVGSRFTSGFAVVEQDYRNDIKNPKTWWKPSLCERLLGAKGFSELPEIHQKIAQRNHFEYIAKSIGIQKLEMLDKVLKQELSANHPDHPGGDLVHYERTVNLRAELKDNLHFGKTVLDTKSPMSPIPDTTPNSDYVETLANADVPDTTVTSSSPEQSVKLTAIKNEKKDNTTLALPYQPSSNPNNIAKRNYEAIPPANTSSIIAERYCSTNGTCIANMPITKPRTTVDINPANTWSRNGSCTDGMCNFTTTDNSSQLQIEIGHVTNLNIDNALIITTGKDNTAPIPSSLISIAKSFITTGTDLVFYIPSKPSEWISSKLSKSYPNLSTFIIKEWGGVVYFFPSESSKWIISKLPNALAFYGAYPLSTAGRALGTLVEQAANNKPPTLKSAGLALLSSALTDSNGWPTYFNTFLMNTFGENRGFVVAALPNPAFKFISTYADDPSDDKVIAFNHATAEALKTATYYYPLYLERLGARFDAFSRGALKTHMRAKLIQTTLGMAIDMLPVGFIYLDIYSSQLLGTIKAYFIPDPQTRTRENKGVKS